MAEQRGRMLALSLAALGVVYGDIGTSPLYAFKVAFEAGHRAGLDPVAAATGICSLIIWSLVSVVSIKYAILILRADNHGEGGVVAMLALLEARDGQGSHARTALLIVGLIGAALLYGDGAITPAISVLSAIEGIKAEAPALTRFVIPLTVVVLFALFATQSKGTGFVGRIFGPVMAGWFVVIGALGLIEAITHPAVFVALTPWPAMRFVAAAPWGVSFAVLGAVFLAVTGGEAMYADMGHFGRPAIRFAWFGGVLPALLLNYLGQAALVSANPAQAANPFYGLAPDWLRIPLIVFATAATVIASQAIISGVFSLTQQSIQLGLLPRLRIEHTAEDVEGQIYLPLANWLLALGTLTAVLAFRSSDALAGAYGIAVSALMAISTFLAALVARKWGYNLGAVLAVNGALMAIDLLFFAANALKLLEGGWFPLVIAGVIAFLMLTWRHGVLLVERARRDERESEGDFLRDLAGRATCRTPGVGAFLSGVEDGIPLSLSHHLRHNRSLQERVLLVAVTSENVPRVAADERATLTPLGGGIERVHLKYGFAELVAVPERLEQVTPELTADERAAISYYIGRETIIADGKIAGMAPWRESLFAWMQRNAAPTGASFCMPSRQLVEVGMEVRI